MANFLKSLFFGETDESEETKLNRNFDVLKYDGIKALKIGKNTYAIRCFNEALKLKEDVEVLEHLVGAYNREDRMEEAIETAGRLVDIEPDNIPVLLMRANLNFMAEKYEAAIADCNRVIALDATCWRCIGNDRLFVSGDYDKGGFCRSIVAEGRDDAVYSGL